MIDLDFRNCPFTGSMCTGKDCKLWHRTGITYVGGECKSGMCAFVRIADGISPRPTQYNDSEPTGRPRYAEHEVTLFRSDKTALPFDDFAPLWVVEYLGSGHYFDSFEEAIDYINQRHAADGCFGTRKAIYD